MKCASCKVPIQGKPHEWIPTLLPDGRINPRMHAVCSPACVNLCRRGVMFVRHQWFHITDHLTPDRVDALIDEHGRQAYLNWEAHRGIAVTERIN